MPSTSISAILPTELQKLILPHLDRASFANLRATDRHYRDLVTRDSPSLWRAHHDARWPNGKRARAPTPTTQRIRTRVARWSRLRGWEAHPKDVADADDAGGEVDWHGEYVRRSRLDRTVADRLAALIDSRGAPGGAAWRALMADGEDAADAVRAVVRDPARFASATPGGTATAEAAAALGAAGWRALVGIGRCAAYQEWRALHDNDPAVALDAPPARVEDGAVALAKFYEGRDAVLHAWEADVFRELDALAGVVRERLDDRRGEGPGRPILEVVEAMRCLFRPDEDGSLPRCFSGNVGDYYNHRNSLINHCLFTRKGIPITLAVIYVAIVRRVCGVEMDIIGLPGHIVVGVPPDGADGSPRLFVDPFHEAKTLTLSDCQAIVERYNIAFTDAMVRPIPNEEVWQRMVRNLINSHSRQVMANDGGAESDSTQGWKVAIPLRQLLSDYASRITNFRELVAAPGFCPQFC